MNCVQKPRDETLATLSAVELRPQKRSTKQQPPNTRETPNTNERLTKDAKTIAGLLFPLTPALSPKGARENALALRLRMRPSSAERLNLPFISAEKY